MTRISTEGRARNLLPDGSLTFKALLLCLSLAITVSHTALAAEAEPVLRPHIDEQSIPVEQLAPRARDGFQGEALLRKPPGNGPFPAVILIHGGAPRWPSQELWDFVLHTHASRFLAAGYVVVAMTRRDLDLDLPVDAIQPAVLDTLAVVEAVRELPYVDQDSLLLRGTSVGGYLALEAGAATEVAAITVEEPFSFPFVGVSLNSEEQPIPDSSKIDAITAPLLLVRGDQTPNINHFNREVFIPALEAAGKSLLVLTYPGELHSFAFYDNEERTRNPDVSLQAFQAIDGFFRQHLHVQPEELAGELVEFQVIDMGRNTPATQP